MSPKITPTTQPTTTAQISATDALAFNRTGSFGSVLRDDRGPYRVHRRFDRPLMQHRKEPALIAALDWGRQGIGPRPLGDARKCQERVVALKWNLPTAWANLGIAC